MDGNGPIVLQRLLNVLQNVVPVVSHQMLVRRVLEIPIPSASAVFP